MQTHFKDAIVIVTGGASGIGKELVRQLAELGAVVIVIDRNRQGGREVAKELQRAAYPVSFMYLDMLQPEKVEATFNLVKEEHGRIDYVINNAGSFMAGEIRDTPLKNWHTIIDENIFAVLNGTHYAYQIMLGQGYGHIVNMGSAAGLFPVPAMGIYGASKYAIVGLTQALRLEAKEVGIKASVVCPTIVNTPLYDTATYNNVNKQKALKTRDSVQTPPVAARRIIRGIYKNKPVIHTAFITHTSWLIYRIAPSIYSLISAILIRVYRKKLRITG